MKDETGARCEHRTNAQRARRPSGATAARAALSIVLAFALAHGYAAETSHRLAGAASSPVKTHDRVTPRDANASKPTPRAPQDHFEITAHVIAAGASKPSTSACFRMNATIGEPVAGTSTSAHYILKGGFMAPRSTRRDAIFSNAFEDCTP
jgi:hypothetical protein